MAGIDVDESTAQEPVRRTGRGRVMIVAGLVVVALSVTAGFVVPQVLHSQRVAENAALTDELRSAFNDRAEAETTLQAAKALTHARHSEALSVAESVATLGDAKEPMLPTKRAKLLRDAAATAEAEMGPLTELEDDSKEVHALLTTVYVEAKAAEESERKEAEDTGAEAPERTMPGSIAEMSVAQATQLIDTPIVPEEVTRVVDEEVTPQLIEELKVTIASVTDEIARADDAIAAETTRQEFLSTTVLAMLPPLQETAASIDKYHEAVENAASKATSDVADNTRTAAEHVRDSADATDVAELYSRIASFVHAGEAALTSHAAVVEAEEAEANRLAEERAAQSAAPQNSAPQNSSAPEGWASGGLCNHWAPLGGGMYMAPC